jgi:methanogenic corrinoid protein MtbC1
MQYGAKHPRDGHKQDGPSVMAAAPVAVPGAARPRDRLVLLAAAIEAEIVPRLVAGHDHGARGRALPSDREHAGDAACPPELALAPVPQDAVDLARQAIGDDGARILDVVAEAVSRHGLEAVCLDLLAPAARHLGDLWCEDICSFADVTIGLMRLQAALLHVSAPQTLPAGCDAAPCPRRTVLLAPAPGDQHTFGLTMVAGFLERAGWTVTQLQDGSPACVEAALRAGWFGVLGLSAGSTVKLKAMPRMLVRLRAMSRNPDLGIMVGGPVFLAEPALARELGADATAADGSQAVVTAEALIAPRTLRRARAPEPVRAATG